MGVFFRPFCGLYYYPCCCFFVWTPECRYFFRCGLVWFQPPTGPDRIFFLHCAVVVFRPLAGTYSIILAKLLDSECAYVTGDVRMTYLTITLALHIHFLVIQHCLGGKTMDASPKGYDLRPPLRGGLDNLTINQ